MENVTDALQMAAFVLIFVVALSIGINAFGQARQTSQIILGYKDREYDYTYIENDRSTNREVRAETIVPSIYKAYKENYKIVFKFNDTDMYLYRKGEDITNATPISYIDLEKEVLGSNTRKEDFIMALLYGIEALEGNSIEEKRAKINSDIHLNSGGLYDIIKGRSFRESLGVYYQEEVGDTTDTTPEANKTKKRVITYEENII